MYWIMVYPLFNGIKVKRLNNTIKILNFLKSFHSASNIFEISIV